MAKATTKPATKTARKVASPKADGKASSASIEQTCEEVRKKLQDLGVDQQLQSDLEWCLGSYRFDKNPSGLYEMAERALNVLNEEKTKKTKGVTAKLISDLEKVLKDRQA